MSDFRKLSDTMLASPQITAADIAEAKAQGVSLIINNRPDGEDTDQPTGDTIAEAARSADIGYATIPVTQAGFSMPQVEAMADAIESASGTVLAYCRSGTRSTLLWSLARAKQGANPTAIEQAAMNAGYDITPVKPMIAMLADRSG